jgi:hypothetical protein
MARSRADPLASIAAEYAETVNAGPTAVQVQTVCFARIVFGFFGTPE